MTALFALLIPSSGNSPSLFPLTPVPTEAAARANARTSLPRSPLDPAFWRFVGGMVGALWRARGVRWTFLGVSVGLAAAFRRRVSSPWKLLLLAPVAFVASTAILANRRRRKIKGWTRGHTTNEYKAAGNIKRDPVYKDAALLARAAATPVGSLFQHISYQPMPGYCGYATLNTVICSIATQRGGPPTSLGLLPYTTPTYVSLRTMLDLLARLRNSRASGIRAFQDLSCLTREEFHAVLRRDLADTRVRLVVCFHRAPLFFNDVADGNKPGGSAMAVHWSPLVGYVEEGGVAYVVVADVNEAYGTWVVSAERLWDACGDGVVEYGGPGGGRMGLVRIEVDV